MHGRGMTALTFQQVIESRGVLADFDHLTSWLVAKKFRSE